MNENRLAREILSLENQFPVKYNLKDQWYAVGIEFPSGWDPQRGPILFEVSNTYPQDPPTAYIRDEFTYQGGSPKLKRWCKKSDWSELCIHPTWDPDNHSTLTWLKLAIKGLENPNSSNPWEGR